MKKIILVLSLLWGSFGLQAQDYDQTLPGEMDDLQQSFEEIFKFFGGMFNDSSFYQMDTTFMRSFQMPFDGEMMPFDTSFFQSFTLPFDGQSMPFDNEELFQNMQEMMDGFLKNFMGLEGVEQWQPEGEEIIPEDKSKPEKPALTKPSKKRKKYIL